MKKVLLLILSGLMPFWTGCRTAQAPWSGELSEDDQRLAEAMAHYAQGLIHEAESGWISAQTHEAFARAAARDTSQYTVHYNLALACLHQRRFDEALATLEAFSRNNPDHPLVELDLAAFAVAAGNPDAAIDYYRRAIRRDPPDLWPYLDLARLLFQKMEDAEALSALARALHVTIDRTPLDFAYEHARAFLAEGTYERAIDVFEWITSHTKTDLSPSFLLQHGAAYERASHFDQAEAVFERCLELYPGTHEVLNYLAYMWAERGVHLEQALDYVKRALEYKPDSGAYIDTLGWIYYQMGRYPEALKHLKKANRLMPDDPTVTDHVGDAYAALGDRNNAIRYWEKSYALDSGNAAVAAKLEAQGSDPATDKPPATP